MNEVSVHPTPRRICPMIEIKSRGTTVRLEGGHNSQEREQTNLVVSMPSGLSFFSIVWSKVYVKGKI
jgi:hypothetical protein